MKKERISRCTVENVALLHLLKGRVEDFKQNPIGTKTKALTKKHTTSTILRKITTPKSLISLKIEANYAAFRVRQHSELIRFVIKKEAAEFIKIKELKTLHENDKRTN